MSNLCPFPQHATHVADALAIVLAPETSRPQQRLLAWAALKTARGQTMSQLNLARLQKAQQHTTPLILDQAHMIGGAA